MHTHYKHAMLCRQFSGVQGDNEAYKYKDLLLEYQYPLLVELCHITNTSHRISASVFSRIGLHCANSLSTPININTKISSVNLIIETRTTQSTAFVWFVNIIQRHEYNESLGIHYIQLQIEGNASKKNTMSYINTWEEPVWLDSSQAQEKLGFTWHLLHIGWPWDWIVKAVTYILQTFLYSFKSAITLLWSGSLELYL